MIIGTQSEARGGYPDQWRLLGTLWGPIRASWGRDATVPSGRLLWNIGQVRGWHEVGSRLSQDRLSVYRVG